MIVLVDTSVWFRFLTNRMPYAAELLAGERRSRQARSGIRGVADRGFRRASTDLELIRTDSPHSTRRAGDVVSFVRSNKLHGKGIGWTDAHLLASALVAGAPLWTADEHLARLAGELGIAYRSGRS